MTLLAPASLLSYILGIICGRYIYLSSFILIVSLFLLLSLIIPKGKVAYSIPLARKVSVYIILTAFCLLGYYLGSPIEYGHSHIKNFISNDRVSIKGKIIEQPEYSTRNTKIILKTDELIIDGMATHVSGNIHITYYNTLLELRKGDYIQVDDVRIKAPRNFNNPGGFDYKAYLSYSEIYAICSAGKNSIRLLKRGDNTITALLYDIRGQAISFIKDSLPFEESSVLIGMVLGEKRYISNRIKEAFIASGIAHILVVSGLNVGFIAISSYQIIKYILFYLGWYLFPRFVLQGTFIKISAITAILPVVLYTGITGSLTPAVRAAIMSSIFLLSICIERTQKPFATLAVAAFIILLWEPYSLFKIDFQLSFITVLSIIYGIHRKGIFNAKGREASTLPLGIGSKGKEEALDTLSNIYSKIKDYTYLSSFALLAATPLTIFYFHIITPYSLLVNVLITPIASIITPIIMLAVIIIPFNNFIPFMILIISGMLTGLIIKCAIFVTSLPYVLAYVTKAESISFIILILTLILLMWRKIIGLKLTLVIVFLIMIFLCLTDIIMPSSSRNELKVTFLDVGNGDSTVIQFPNNEVMLVDSGGRHGDFDMGRAVVIPYLLYSNILSVKHLLATHDDMDHIGGLFSIINGFNIRFLWNTMLGNSGRGKGLAKAARHKGILNINPMEEREIYEGGVKVQFIHPTPEYLYLLRQKGKRINDNTLSVAARLTYRDISLLMAGDLDREAEAYILHTWREPIKSNIMKLSNHGSIKSSSIEFLDKIAPEVVIISVGFENHFGHPNKEILTQLDKRGIPIFRTDQDGAITLITDGNSYRIKTFNSKVAREAGRTRD